jgi:uncharacterized membrane protein
MASKSKNEEEDGLRTLGTILELVGVPILIIVAILLNMPDKDLGVISVLLVVGVCMFFAGLMLSHLPRQSEKEEKKNAKEICTHSFDDSCGCSDSDTSFSGVC